MNNSKIFMGSLTMLLLLYAILPGASASGMQIVKIEDSQVYYSGSVTSYLLSSVTSGWTVSQAYGVSFWMKYNGHYSGNWEGFARFGNIPSSSNVDYYNSRVIFFSANKNYPVMFSTGMTGDGAGDWTTFESGHESTLLPTGQSVFLVLATNTTANQQNAFRYTVASTSSQTAVFGSRRATGLFYDLTINGTYSLGGDPAQSVQPEFWQQYLRLYLNYFPNSTDEMTNLAIMDTGILYIIHFSSVPEVNNNQTALVNYIQETTSGTLTPYKGLSPFDTANDPILNIPNVLSCQANTILSFNVGGIAPNGVVFAMDIQPYSGGPSTQTLFSIRDGSTNLVSFVAELSDSTGYITFYRKDSNGTLAAIRSPSSNYALEKNAWNRLIVEYIQAQPQDLPGVYYSVRVFIGSSKTTLVYFEDSVTSPTQPLFFGVNNMTLDICSQVVDGATPTTLKTTNDGNFDILNFLWFAGPSSVYQSSIEDPTCMKTVILNQTQSSCLLCEPGYYFYDRICVTECPLYTFLHAGTGSCQMCEYSQYQYYYTTGACIKCSLHLFNNSCLATCPDGYVVTNSGRCGKCSDNNIFYYNHTCVSSCPLATFSVFDVVDYENECQPCYLGCDACVDDTSSGCLNCSAGFFYSNNSCNSGCPPDMYADTETRQCEQCPSPCSSCSQPNNYSCTSCPTGYLLFNGTCVTSCPVDYYQSLFSGEGGVYQVPACLPKLILTFNLSLTTDARTININFNYGIINMILAFSQMTQIQIADTQIDDVLFVLSPVTESIIKFEYLGDQYYPSLSLLNVTIDLDTTSFNTNSFQQFLIINNTATIQLKEIYPFTNTEIQFISSASSVTGTGGNVIAGVQTVSSLAQGSLSLSLVRLQIVGEIIQFMRFIDIQWPANVAQFYANTHIDPSSIVMPIDFTTGWNDQLNNRNYSIPRVFDEYQISPFFSENYNNELSNLAVWVPTVVFGSLLINLLRKFLGKMANKISVPTKKKKKIGDNESVAVVKLSQFMNRVDVSGLWNFLLMFILSIYQSGNLWALLNIRYSSALLESSTSYTSASLSTGIIFLVFYFLLAAFVTKILLNNLKYLLQTKEESRPAHLEKYQVLYVDFNSQKRLQLLFVPISLLRSLIFASVIALLSVSPIAQISLFWAIDSAFILYLTVYQPLKEKWMRRITLTIEVLSYGCITFAFILGIVTQFVKVDATSLDETGFVFISMSIGSTLAGGILSLIQIVQLLKAAYKYLKDLRNKKTRVHPVSISETNHGTDHITPKILTLTEALDQKSSKRFYMPKRRLNESPEDSKMFEGLGKLSVGSLRATPNGTQFYDELKVLWNSYHSKTSNEIFNIDSSNDIVNLDPNLQNTKQVTPSKTININNFP